MRSELVWSVELSSTAQKKIRKLPYFVISKFETWVAAVELEGLAEVRRAPGYHDEPLAGELKGLRSIRLNRSYRAYYRVLSGKLKVIWVERIDKHEY